MIPGLLHGRILGAPPAGGIIAVPAYRLTQAIQSAAPSAAATATFQINPDGTWTANGTGFGPLSGTWYSPVTGGIGSGFEVRITPTLSSGVAGVVTNQASGWVALSSARLLSLFVQRFTEGTTASNYNVLVEIRPTGGAVASAASFVMTSTATVPPAGGGGGGCVDVDMWLQPGLLAGEIQIGQRIDCALYEPDGIERRAVSNCPIAPQPCWRIVTPSGAAVVASDTTPMTLRDGSSVFLPDMLGREVLVVDGNGLRWEQAVECYPVGFRRVVKINVGGTCYFAGESPTARIATHNTGEKS